jgi:transcriptional regulator with XRE-family HTH domain
MESHILLKDLLRKTSAKQLAGDLGLSLSLIYKWAEVPATDAGSGTINPLDRVAQLLKTTGDPRIAQWVCERADGFFVANPRPQTGDRALLPATNEIVKEFADMLAVIAAAAANQDISREEAADIRARWEELKSVTEAFVHAAEHGNYHHLPESGQAGGKSPRRR